ncbi:MAG: peptidoglycan-binding protein [Bryobacteraceae bacterium]
MPMYTVVQGDCLSSIALRYGFADWRTIYNHGNNAEFRRLRPNPNLIYPGDSLYIPDTDTRTDPAATDAWHEYKVEGQKTFVRVRMLDADMAALAGKKYRLVANGKTTEGTLGGDGMIEQEIAADSPDARLTVWLDEDTSRPGVIWDVRLGHLDPVDTPTGIQARLRNLGYNPGPIDGDIGPLTQAAIRGFQSRFGLTVDGIAGPITQGKLKEIHEGG